MTRVGIDFLVPSNVEALFVARSDILKPSGNICQLQFSEESENIPEWSGFPYTALYYHGKHSQLIRNISIRNIQIQTLRCRK